MKFIFLAMNLFVAIALPTVGLEGVFVFFIRSEINYSVRSDLICEHIESLTVEIKKPRSRPFAVMTWYRPPDSSIDLFRPFEELIGKLDSENIEYYILGDLNCKYGRD